MHDGHVLATRQVQHSDSAAHVRRQHVDPVVVGRSQNALGERAPGREYVIAIQPKVFGQIVGFVPSLVSGQGTYPRLAHGLVGQQVGYGALRQPLAAALQGVRVELREAQPDVTGPAVLAALDLEQEHFAGQQATFAKHNCVGETHLALRHRFLVVKAKVKTMEPVKPRLLIGARFLGHGRTSL